MSKFSYRKQKQNNQGLFKNPLFYFGFMAFFLWGMPFFGFEGLAKIDNLENSQAAALNPFFKNSDNFKNYDLFLKQNSQLAKESPDLKIIENNSVHGISTPRILTTQTLGDLFGELSQIKKEVVDYIVESGDTVELVAKKFNILTTTLALANNISKNSSLGAGQNLTILPLDGLLHVVKLGDTVGGISKKYEAKADDVVSFNNLSGEGDIFVGDVLVVPGGVMPSKPVVSIQTSLPDSFFIFSTEGTVTQGLHYYNAIDVANRCGTPVYAAASGIVQRARYDYRYGNYITVLHSNGVVSYYGHLETIFVKSGDQVNVGDKIASMGRTGGKSTGCHLHFGVTGARNPLAGYYVGAAIKYK